MSIAYPGKTREVEVELPKCVLHALEHHFVGHRYEALRKILRVLAEAHVCGHRLTRREIESATGYKDTFATHRLQRLRQLTERWGEAYGFHTDVTEFPNDGTPPTHGLVVHDGPFHPAQRRLVTLGDYHRSTPDDLPEDEVLILSDAIRSHIETALTSPERGKRYILSQQTPPNAEMLIRNSTWVLAAEKKEVEIARLLVNAARGGRGERVLTLQRELDIPQKDKNLLVYMDSKTFRWAPELGFVIQCLPKRPGVAGIFFIEPMARAELMFQRHGESVRESTFFEKVASFDDEEWSKRLVRQKNLDPLVRRGLRLLGKAQNRGKPLGSVELGESLKRSRSWVNRKLVDWSEEHRNELGFFVRHRVDQKLDCALLVR